MTTVKTAGLTPGKVLVPLWALRWSCTTTADLIDDADDISVDADLEEVGFLMKTENTWSQLSHEQKPLPEIQPGMMTAACEAFLVGNGEDGGKGAPSPALYAVTATRLVPWSLQLLVL